MPGTHERPLPPRLALTVDEAADAIGVSESLFYRDVLPELKVVRLGRKRIIQVGELERWLSARAERVGAA